MKDKEKQNEERHMSLRVNELTVYVSFKSLNLFFWNFYFIFNEHLLVETTVFLIA